MARYNSPSSLAVAEIIISFPSPVYINKHTTVMPLRSTAAAVPECSATLPAGSSSPSAL